MRLSGLIAAVCVLALGTVGCGADDSDPTREELEQVRLRAFPPSDKPTTDGRGQTQSSAIPSNSGGDRKRSSRALSAEATVRRYFHEITTRDFERAWARLSPEVQTQFGGYEAWVSGYGRSVSTELLSTAISEKSPRRIVMTVRISSEDAQASGGRLTQVFEGPWTLEKRGADWIVTAAQFTQIE